MNPFDVFLITPFLNILIATYKLLAALSIPGALGFSIIILSAAIRLILWPLTTSQLKSAQKMAALKPHLDRIKAEHGHDKVRHQQEVSKLYKEHGVNPAAGCLPVLLQIPVFISLYNVLQKIVVLDKVEALSAINNKLYFPSLHLHQLPSTSFLGVHLATKPSQWHEVGFLILLIPIVTGLLQFAQSKMMTPQKSNALKANTDNKGGLEDSMAQMQSQMVLLMPLMIAFFSYGFPVGLSLYWNTFTVIAIVQQYKVAGAGSLNKYLPAKWKK